VSEASPPTGTPDTSTEFSEEPNSTPEKAANTWVSLYISSVGRIDGEKERGVGSKLSPLCTSKEKMGVLVAPASGLTSTTSTRAARKPRFLVCGIGSGSSARILSLK
jgi:hypothetical protein